MKHQSDELDQKIKVSVDQIDTISVPVPELNYFTNLIQQQEIRNHIKQNHQFFMFMGFAVMIISLLFYFLVSHTIIFFVLQGLSVIVPFLWLTYARLIRKERVR